MSTTKKFYVGIKNEAATGTLELHFLDYIYDGFDWNTYEYKSMVQDTINQIKAANPSKIKVVINSLGGDVMIGLAIFNYLKSSGIEVETENIGFAASIASIMMMAGGKRKMARNAFMILHAAWSYASGNATEMRQQAENLDKVSNELADIYATTSGKYDAKHFTDMWAGGDVWLSGQECLEMGLVTELTGEVAVSASVDFSQYGFRNVPAQLMASAAPEQKSISTQIQEGFMKLKDSLLNIFNAKKEDTSTNNITNKDEVLALVKSVLEPFAEAMDAKLDELNAAGPAPAAEATPETTVVEETPVVETPETPAANNELAELKAEFEAFKLQMVNASTKPAPARTGANNVMDKVQVEHGE